MLLTTLLEMILKYKFQLDQSIGDGTACAEKGNIVTYGNIPLFMNVYPLITMR